MYEAVFQDKPHNMSEARCFLHVMRRTNDEILDTAGKLERQIMMVTERCEIFFPEVGEIRTWVSEIRSSQS